MKTWKGILLSIVCGGIALTAYFLFKNPPVPKQEQVSRMELVEQPWQALSEIKSFPGIKHEELDSFAIASLKAGDSIIVEAIHAGCFTYQVQRHIIKREEKGFSIALLHVDPYGKKQAGTREYFDLDYELYMAPVLRVLQASVRDVAMKTSKKDISIVDEKGRLIFSPEEPYTLSTSSTSIYVNAGNKVWDLSQIEMQWPPYRHLHGYLLLMGSEYLPI